MRWSRPRRSHGDWEGRPEGREIWEGEWAVVGCRVMEEEQFEGRDGHSVLDMLRVKCLWLFPWRCQGHSCVYRSEFRRNLSAGDNTEVTGMGMVFEVTGCACQVRKCGMRTTAYLCCPDTSPGTGSPCPLAVGWQPYLLALSRSCPWLKRAIDPLAKALLWCGRVPICISTQDNYKYLSQHHSSSWDWLRALVTLYRHSWSPSD